MISIDELERAAAPGWRGVEEEPLGGWLLRAAEGFTGRANSALAAGDPGMPVTGAAKRVTAWYRARGLPAMIAVPYPAAEPHRSALDTALARLGWTPRARPATVMIAAADRVAAADGPLRVDISNEPDDAWLARYHYAGTPRPPAAGVRTGCTCRSRTTMPRPARCTRSSGSPITTAITTGSGRP